jgi:DNA topoisomerase-3
MSPEEMLVYTAIVNQYVAQFLPEKSYLSVKAVFETGGHEFVARSTKVTAAGWSALLSDRSEGDGPEDEGDVAEDAESPFDTLSALGAGEQGQCESVDVSKKKTKPLPLYTERTLLLDLRQVAKYVTDPRIKALLLERDEGKKGERGGIGTPATRSAMLKTLKDRGYCVIESKKFIPTKLGLSFYKVLPRIATSPDMTALWHEQQQKIESGEMSVDAFLDELEVFIQDQINSIDLGDLQGAPQVNGNCPMCGSGLRTSAKAVGCRECDWRIWKELAGKTLTEAQIEILLSKGRTGVLKGFVSKKSGRSFDAVLQLNPEGKVLMEAKRA